MERADAEAALELELTVPTYNYTLFADDVDQKLKPEFGEPTVPVVVRGSLGVQIILGTHDAGDVRRPDVQIERQPNGWMIFLHPLGGSDASGCVYFLDNGRSFLRPENGLGPTEAIRVLSPDEQVPGFDVPV